MLAVVILRVFCESSFACHIIPTCSPLEPEGGIAKDAKLKKKKNSRSELHSLDFVTGYSINEPLLGHLSLVV
ncbi:hypothetical protein BX600DRAFT_279110 [Xylariales sp. PMI_506]|nr:hypothetical protein BX600DRAFT_279110 [Xylariales sp. PMI_506]